MLDPFQQVYAHLEEQARRDVLAQAHDKTTWRYKRKPALRFRASEAGNCPRRIWYRLSGYVPAPDSPDLLLKQVDGNISQDIIRQLMRDAGVQLSGIKFKSDGTQVETLEEKGKVFVASDGTNVTVSARADGQLETPRGSALFEFKTMQYYPAHWLGKAFEGGGEVDALNRLQVKHLYYVEQMQITMAVFGISLTWFGHKDKSSSMYGFVRDNEHCGLYLAYDQGMVDEILMVFAEVQAAVRAGTPIPFSHTKVPMDGSGQCSFCPFYYQCYGAKSRGGTVIYPGTESE